MSQLVGGVTVGGCDVLSSSPRCRSGLWYDGEESERLKRLTCNERITIDSSTKLGKQMPARHPYAGVLFFLWLLKQLIADNKITPNVALNIYQGYVLWMGGCVSPMSVGERWERYLLCWRKVHRFVNPRRGACVCWVGSVTRTNLVNILSDPFRRELFSLEGQLGFFQFVLRTYPDSFSTLTQLSKLCL